MRSINLLIVHCSATGEHTDIGAKEIDRWHRSQGWLCIGYHYVIRRNGVLEHGRDEGVIGAHAKGYNTSSVGICMVGGVDADDITKAEDNFTPEQWATLDTFVRDFLKVHSGSRVIGHREVERHKACPSFDVQEWKARVGITAPGL